MLLAIDTATRVMSLALHDGKSLLAEQSWSIGNQHSTLLTPAVAQILDTCGLTPADLTGLAACTGPGSFTGLRIGVATAKGIAAAQGLPLVGASSLDILAASQPYHQTGAGLIAVVQAGRGRIIVRTYRWRKGQWSSRAEPQLMTWKELLATIDGPALISGEVNAAGLNAIHEAQEKEIPVTIATAAHRLRRAGFLAEYAVGQIETTENAAEVFAASKLLPVYIKTDSV